VDTLASSRAAKNTEKVSSNGMTGESISVTLIRALCMDRAKSYALMGEKSKDGSVTILSLALKISPVFSSQSKPFLSYWEVRRKR
jgi:hypothetical protein